MQKYGHEGENHLKVGSQKIIEKFEKIDGKYGLAGRKWCKKLTSEPSWSHLGPTEASSTEKVANRLIFDPPWAPQIGGQNPTKIVKNTIPNLMFFDNTFWNGFSSNLRPTWHQLGPQNLPKLQPSLFPRGVGQANRQNKQNVHGA